MSDTTRRRILLIGANGQVGWELLRTLPTLGGIVATEQPAAAAAQPSLRAMDIADPDAIRATVREVRPQLIVNAAAYTAVDQAEDDAELAMAINGVVPGVLAEEAQRIGAGLVHYSTDYVFDGSGTAPYHEDDAPNPLNVYGSSKLAGERAIAQVGGAHLIFRTSWVYGARGKNFLLTLLRLARERPELNIVADQVGAPNWSRLLAEATALALANVIGATAARNGDWPAVLSRMQEVSGVYHLSSTGTASWCDFARAIIALAARSGDEAPVCTVNGITTDQYPTRARRPLNSRLSTDKFTQTFGLTLPAWDDALRLCMEDVR